MKMTKTILISMLCVVVLLVSCSKEESTPDNSINATYTGVLVGSTGAYKAVFSASGSRATILFDGTTYELTSTETLKKGETLGLTDGTVKLTIKTDADGKNPELSFDIPGHTITAVVVEETALTENYIGEVIVTKNGLTKSKITLNITLYEGNKIKAITKIIENEGVDEGKVEILEGTYVKSGSTILITYQNNGETVVLASSIFENTLNSTFTDTENGTTEVKLIKV